MNTLKKLFSLWLALALILALAVPVMADDTYTITIANSNAGHTFEAYQIFTGSLLDGSKDEDETTTGLILSNIKWGTSIKDSAALINALKNDNYTIKYLSGDSTATTTLSAIFSSVNETGDAAAAQIASTLGSNQPVEVVDRFAEVVGHYRDSNHTYLQDAVGTVTYENGVYTISGLPAGYYLVKDQEGSQTNQHDFYTKYMLQVVHSITLQPKGSIPSLDKEINKTIGGTYTDANSFDINDDIYFKLTGTLPENLDAYSTYYYKFVDTMAAGLSFRELEQVEIMDHDGNASYMIYDRKSMGSLPSGVSEIQPVTDESGVTTWSLEFTDLKSLYPALAPDDKVVVKYRAYLNRKAAIDAPNENYAELYYSNNPSGTGTGKTISDYAHAFTHRIGVVKREMGSNKTLENVKFLLYFTRSHAVDSSGGDATNTADTDVVTKHYYAQVITEEMVAANAVINDKQVTAADVGVVYGWTETVGEASVLDTDNKGEFTVRGLDSGTYYLRETETNSGYNLLTNDVRVTIEAVYTGTDTAGAGTTVTYSVGGSANGSLHDTNNGVVIIENSKGNTLPTTGGVGTTLFYIGGGILVVAAVVLLITKKRMSSES